MCLPCFSNGSDEGSCRGSSEEEARRRFGPEGDARDQEKYDRRPGRSTDEDMEDEGGGERGGLANSLAVLREAVHVFLASGCAAGIVVLNGLPCRIG